MKYTKHIETAYKAQKPFVVFKNPNENTVSIIKQNTDELHEFCNFNMSGYVLAPFNNSEKAFIIQPDVYEVDEVNFVDVIHNNIVDTNQEIAKTYHINIVDKAIKAIKNTELSKIVISRVEELYISKFDIVSVYQKLVSTYRNAYVYVWFHPKVGLWMGATPETLLHVKNNRFKTMALAGTQPYKGNLNPKWGTKELEEQQMVSDYIKQHLKNTVNNLNFSEVETTLAGSLLHLKTNISGELKSSNDLSTLVKLLHPTPAVCGLPKELSKTFILENENYHRSFYSGYLGKLNMDNETSFYVNLRCFKLVNNKLLLYVGGGITADSNAENEWKETVEKSKIVKAVL